jgi:phosphohistidine phosphatase
MKTLILVRHAKSSWASIGQLDFDRPLNDRGKKDAAAMGEELFNENIQIDLFVSSPAKRARKTCKAFVEAYDKNINDIVFIEKLYHATKAVFYDVINTLDNKENIVAIFSHNPGITEFASSLCSDRPIVDMPTCGAFAVQAAVNSWLEFESATKKFLFFKTPKG